MIGFSLGFVDKRVDSIIKSRGYKAHEIFYSPIASWFFVYFLILMISLPIFIRVSYNYLSYNVFKYGVIIILGYLFVEYVIISCLNSNFAITQENFLVVKSHFPFEGVRSIRFEEVKEVKISSDKIFRTFVFLGFAQRNYVQIKTSTGIKKFYCLFLNVDCYNENWTEKTLDDLEESLRLRDVNVKMEVSGDLSLRTVRNNSKV